MSRIIDRTQEAMGWNHPWQTRNQNQITRIVVHHSATAGGDMRTFENHWRAKGWRNGGYAEIILLNGDVELCYPPTVVTNGAGAWNPTSYHICLVGNFRKNGAQPTAAQLQSFLDRIRFNMNRLNVPVNKVKGHKELMPTICPGMNMTNLRNQVRQHVQTPPASNHTRFINHRIPLRSRANASSPEVGARLIVGQEVRLLGNTVRSTNRLGNWVSIAVGNRRGWVRASRLGTTRPATTAIRVGARVRVNNTAQSWATGQTIPTWVRGQTYVVQQIRNNNNELLLAGVMSWIRRDDVTMI